MRSVRERYPSPSLHFWFEDAIRNTISLGGEADTMGAVTGVIASAFYGAPNELREKGRSYLTEDLLEIMEAFEAKYELK